jgi:Recombination endonuclease VII
MPNKDPIARKASNKSWKAANPEKVKANAKLYRERHKAELYEKYKEWERESKRKDPEAYKAKTRRTNLKKAYGITIVEWDRMFAAQNGVCAICHRPETTGQRLSVDHNHKTGKVRGLLCHRCNRGMGVMGDDPLILRSAAHYLESHQ